MGKGGYTGGSTVIKPWSNWFGRRSDIVEPKRPQLSPIKFASDDQTRLNKNQKQIKYALLGLEQKIVEIEHKLKKKTCNQEQLFTEINKIYKIKYKLESMIK